MSTVQGHCACGALSYTIKTDSLDKDLQLSTCCHCSKCQRLNGAPYVWSTHWRYGSVTWDPKPIGPPPGAQDLGKGENGTFSSAMETYELMPKRKWKLRCKTCGSPMGSWNAVKQKWTIWPTTLNRRPASTSSTEENEGESKAVSGVNAQGEFDVPADVMQRFKPDHHQFYAAWRSVTLHDGLPKWEGYKNQSQQVDDDGNAV